MTEKSNSTTSFNIRIPGYQLKRLLGKGGMASVYLAVQESFGRDVAIKILSPDLAQDKEFSQRFLREAQIVSRLQHPNIVTVYDVGIHEGYHYLSMEYVPGKELREAKYDLPKGEVLRIIREVARALDYAHQQGYIHRDVKPENIMLHENGERVVLMDFGIARMTQVNNTVTKTGKVIGTPHYMSPEQTKGLKVDHRSDIYSLGVVLFQMLSGRLPYDADTPVAVGIKHIADPIPTMPPGLEMFQSIINTCMSKSPEHRYQGGAELIAALDKLNMNAVAVLDARNTARQERNRILSDPQAKTQMGTAMFQDETVMADATRTTTNPPQYTIPPLVHPDHRKYQSGQTTMQQPRSGLGKKLMLLFLLLLAGGAAWGYFNQEKVMAFWKHKLQPQVVSLAIKYELIPAPAKPAPPQPAPRIEPAPQTPPAAAPEVVAEVATSPDTDSTGKAGPGLSTEEVAQLKADLQQQPQNALALATYYKQRLASNAGDLAARNGLAELREWYRFELRAAVDNKDLLRARLLADQLQSSFPALAEKPRFHRMLTRLAQAETLQQHLESAARYLTEGALVAPEGANALAEYKIVLALSPQHPEALAGMTKIRDVAYEKALHHQSRGELKLAMDYVNAGLQASSNDRELKALQEKIGSRVERTSRHDTLNKQAEVLFRSGNLIVPEGQSAYDKYSQVLAENPNNLVARAGIRKIEKHLVEYAIIYLEENELEKAEGIIKAARDKYGATPIIEEVQFRLDKAIQASAPKITRILFSATQPASLADMKSQRFRVNKILYVGFEYQNFKNPGSVLQANLLDSSGRVLITSKKITLSDVQGENLFYLTLPTTQLADGSYRLELILGADRLVVGSFFNDNSL